MAVDHGACVAAILVQPEQIADFPWRPVPSKALKDFERHGGTEA
jgi:hypothetical protein